MAAPPAPGRQANSADAIFIGFRMICALVFFIMALVQKYLYGDDNQARAAVVAGLFFLIGPSLLLFIR